jgi:predicted ATPase
LALHFTEAGESEQGIHFWQRAATLAAEKSAHAETLSCVERGLALVQTLDESPDRDKLELSLQVPFGAALVSTRGYAAPEVGPVYDRARELCERAGDQWNSFVVLFGIWAWRLVRDELLLSLELSDQIMALAGQIDDPGIMMEAHHVPANSLYYLGDFEAALTHCTQGFALYDEERCKQHCHRSGQNSGVTLQSYWALANWHLGYPDQALERITSAMELANQLKHPFSQCYSLHFSAWVHQFARLGKEALQYADAEQKLADKHGFAFWSATSRLFRSSALLLLDRVDEALDLAQEGLSTIKATGAALSLSYYNSFLAEAQRRSGRLDEAMQTLDESLEIVTRTQNRFYEAELFRLKGELLLEQSADVSAAESYFEKSLEIAQVQKARSWELRTAISLASLRKKQGRAAEGRKLLAEVHGWFTEGFSTPDLINAKRLLDETV